MDSGCLSRAEFIRRLDQLLKDLEPLQSDSFWSRLLCACDSRVSASSMEAKQSSVLVEQPTVREQVERCRQIAETLVCGRQSKGRRMFEARVQQSRRWTTARDVEEDDSDVALEQLLHEPLSESQLKRVRDPRTAICGRAEDLDEEGNQKQHEVAVKLEESVKQAEQSGSPPRAVALYQKQHARAEHWSSETVGRRFGEEVEVIRPLVVEEPEEVPFEPLRSHRLETVCLQPKSFAFRDFNRTARPFVSFGVVPEFVGVELSALDY